MKLSEIITTAPDINITGLCSDSRKIQAGDMFFCLEGGHFDGHGYAEAAATAGAACIVHRKPLQEKVSSVIYIQTEEVKKLLNHAADVFFGNPTRKMRMFGVTGTNGKTTIASLIQHIYGTYQPCGYIGTISIAYGNKKLAPNLTTPEPILLHEIMAHMWEEGMKACALEVSSHGLEQERVDGVDFDVAVFSNLTYDHLDFHGSFENYFKAKEKLFLNLKAEGIGILNLDDPYGRRLMQITKARKVTYGILVQADYRAIHIRLEKDCTHFKLVHRKKSYDITTNLCGLHNIYNLLAAIACAGESGMLLEKILLQLNCLPQVEGRMERIKGGQEFNVIVDFAHTPDGMMQIFEFARRITAEEGNIIAVFGSAGERDKHKRKMFGALASVYCSRIILTEDDPRTEKPSEIAAEIAEGITIEDYRYIENRYEAIQQAISNAQPIDTLLILGKGDELFMYGKSGREPWMGDHEAARLCLEQRLGN